MIKFFRQSYAIQYVVIALLAIALWIPAFMAGKVPSGMERPVTPIFNLVNGILDFSPYAQLAFAFLLLVFETLIFNAMLVDNQIVGKVSTMGAFVFVLLMSLTVTQTSFYPFALATFFILFMLRSYFSVHLAPKPELGLADAGMLIAFASMCYFPSIVLILWSIIVLPVAKKGTLRLQLIPIMGFLFVYFFYFVGVYLFGDLPSVWAGYREYFTSSPFSVAGFNLKNISLLSLLIVPTAFLLFGSANASFEKTIAVRTKISMTIIMFIFAVLLLFLGGNILMNGLIFIVLAIFVSYAFSYLGNTGWAEMFLVMFVLMVFANHYYFKFL